MPPGVHHNHGAYDRYVSYRRSSAMLCDAVSYYLETRLLCAAVAIFPNLEGVHVCCLMHKWCVQFSFAGPVWRKYNNAYALFTYRVARMTFRIRKSLESQLQQLEDGSHPVHSLTVSDLQPLLLCLAALAVFIYVFRSICFRRYSRPSETPNHEQPSKAHSSTSPKDSKKDL